MKTVLIVGSGKRVREAALPALQRLGDRYAVRGIYARTAKSVEVGGTAYEVNALDALDGVEADLVYVAVTKDAVPGVLERLTSFEVGGTDLLIDTPVVRFKHFRHAAKARAFRNAWVAEDCTELPWLAPVRAAVGEPRRVVFHRSAYAYHGVATAKALLGCDRVTRGRRKAGIRTLAFANGAVAEIVEPRDYSRGWVHVAGSAGSVTDAPDEVAGAAALEAIVTDGACTGLRAGDAVAELDADGTALMGAVEPGTRVTALMDPLKRVGFLRLLKRIADGQGAYPLDAAIDDMVVDYHLEKLGMYVSNPLTSARTGLSRFLLRSLSRVSG